MKSITITLTILLIASFVLVGITSSTPYDPWYDFDDDGDIDIYDIVDIAGRYGTTGTPLNKTEFLLELEARIAALETRIPKDGYISVPPAAFVPVDNTKLVLTTNYLANYDASIAACVGSVQLPHGAAVTSVTVYWRDVGTQAVMTRLRRHNLTHWNEMAYVESVGDIGFGGTVDNSIDYATVDNSRYYYYLGVDIPPSASHLDYQFYYAVIAYEYPA
jgi:hypothetical protein